MNKRYFVLLAGLVSVACWGSKIKEEQPNFSSLLYFEEVNKEFKKLTKVHQSKSFFVWKKKKTTTTNTGESKPQFSPAKKNKLIYQALTNFLITLASKNKAFKGISNNEDIKKLLLNGANAVLSGELNNRIAFVQVLSDYALHKIETVILFRKVLQEIGGKEVYSLVSEFLNGKILTNARNDEWKKKEGLAKKKDGFAKKEAGGL